MINNSFGWWVFPFYEIRCLSITYCFIYCLNWILIRIWLLFKCSKRKIESFIWVRCIRFSGLKPFSVCQNNKKEILGIWIEWENWRHAPEPLNTTPFRWENYHFHSLCICHCGTGEKFAYGELMIICLEPEMIRFFLYENLWSRQM